MNTILVLPVVIPFAAAAVNLLFNGNSGREHRISILGALLHFAACAALFVRVYSSGMQTMQVGNWPAPFGITLAADHLSAVMVIVTAILGLAVTVYSRAEIKSDLLAAGYYPLLHILLGGVSGAFLTGDLFNLYVWFEVMLMASFGLLVLGREKQQFDGGVKYVMINLFSTLLFITGIGLLYGMTGTLNLADLHLAVQKVDNQALLTATAAIFMTAFGIKAGMFPLFFWLPASYHTPPVAVSAILAGLLTKVGVYALIRIFSLVFIFDMAHTHGLLLIAAVATMFTGVLGAAGYNEFRRILSVHIVSQVGYMVLGLSLFTPLALTGAVFFLLHNMIVKSNLFLISGVSARISGTFELKQLGGLYNNHRFLALLFFVSAFSLAGFPPLSGFWAKLILVRAGLETGAYIAAGAAVVVGLLTAYSMTKIWGEAFWKPEPAGKSAEKGRPDVWMLLPVSVLAILTMVIGLLPGPFLAVAEQAAHELTHPEIYVNAVLGGK
ncbi:MAG: Na+/H+ antiporter subunit D [Desulfobacterales bacterium]|nr:Na+/H+ antiporter subunit D [Desulfobacterales bacterium]MBS3755934.1 Na+/H+ antiporter subunit D [Desulfobacterales bacterium]